MNGNYWAEKRKGRRREISVCAVVADAAGRPLTSCLVLDISTGGARLQPLNADRVPPQFTLWLTRSGRPRRDCEVRWRHGREVGVRFTGVSSQFDGAL